MDKQEHQKLNLWHSAVLDMLASRPENLLVLNSAARRALIKLSKPSVYLLMQQGWRNGYVVNGLAP